MTELGQEPEPGGEPGPWVGVSTPDGEVVMTRLGRWQQADDGGWWALCRMSLWAVTTADGRSAPEPSEVAFWAPADKLQPLGDEDYRGVPRTRAHTVVARRRRDR